MLAGLLCNEFPHPPIASAPPVFSPVQPIAVDKVAKVEKSEAG